MKRRILYVLIGAVFVLLLVGCRYEDPVPVNDTPGHMFPLEQNDEIKLAAIYERRQP